ncbi:hypothetical protein BDP27DRAFT_1318077 [Rhodocollybia butyracea]|uniref:Uncharacterized protein n=1 Tax=Rhodocollybia butyracea TaxID=206335 RepID=A0A9P5UC47_9AGAR|nr:hypothetical protein BDP27DRAFT_1318077 [Rhodocollybia butyracea]
MLKRRASSPPPSSLSNIPIISDTTPFEKLRDSKRRRVDPPVLDGQMRGWGTPRDVLYQSFGDEDDGEEDIIDDDNDVPRNTSPDSTYKSTNDFLHELHALQRHRLLFSSNQGHSDKTSHDYGYPLHQPGKGMPDAPLHQREHYDTMPLASEEKRHEFDSVREHYEEMNRLLGSVVLSRRRELGPKLGNNDT